MEQVQRWLREQAAREARRVTLEDALLAGRFWRYSVYRLRYFFARYFAVSAAHALRVVLLYQVFSQEEFVVVIAVQAAVALAGSFWWGGLEVMRARVRSLYREPRPHMVPKEIGRWLSLSIGLSVLLVAGAIGWTALQLAGAGKLVAVDAYVLAVVLALALELPTRCYHSGVYAVRRVYRPLASLLAVEVVSLGSLVALLSSLGAWSFAISTLIAAATATALSLHFSRRVYRFFGFAPAAQLRLHVGRVRLSGLREFLAAGASYGVIAMDSLLVLALFGAGAATLEQPVLFVLFFVLAPTVRAGFEWAQLLYFDLKRLEVAVFTNLKRRFNRYCIQLGWLLGLVFWVLACAIGTLVYGGHLGAFYWAAAPFFVSRSLLAVAQIEAFAERAYRRVLISGAALLGGIVLVRLTLVDAEQVLLYLAALALLAFGLVRLPSGLVAQPRRQLLGLAEWLARARDVDEPVRIRVASLARPTERGHPQAGAQWLYGRIAEGIARNLRGCGEAALIPPRRIAWYERGRGVDLAGGWLSGQCGGFLERLEQTPLQVNGQAALEVACRERLLGAALRRAGGRGAQIASADVEKAFRRMFRSGVVYSPDRPAPAAFDRMSAADRRSVMFDAVRYTAQFRPVRSSSRFDVTAFCPGGELRLIFLVERRVNRRLRSRWHAKIADLNVRATGQQADEPDGARPRMKGATMRIGRRVYALAAAIAGLALAGAAAGCGGNGVAIGTTQTAARNTGTQGSSAASGRQLVGITMSVAANETRTLSVTCPAGTEAAGGGFDTEAPAVTILSSTPFNAGNGWRVRARNGGSATATVYVNAVCASFG